MPRRRSAASSPSVTVVLPAPDRGAEMMRAAVMARPEHYASAPSPSAPSPACGGGRGGGSHTHGASGAPSLPSPASGGGAVRHEQAGEAKEPSLTTVVTTLASLGKTELPQQIARWLDELDETGRWALLKLVTGGLRIGVSARLAKTAVAALGDKDVDEIELVWPALAAPYLELFAWIEGRAEKPSASHPVPFRPVMLSHAIEDADFATLDPAVFSAE